MGPFTRWLRSNFQSSPFLLSSKLWLFCFLPRFFPSAFFPQKLSHRVFPASHRCVRLTTLGTRVAPSPKGGSPPAFPGALPIWFGLLPWITLCPLHPFFFVSVPSRSETTFSLFALGCLSLVAQSKGLAPPLPPHHRTPPHCSPPLTAKRPPGSSAVHPPPVHPYAFNGFRLARLDTLRVLPWHASRDPPYDPTLFAFSDGRSFGCFHIKS